MARVYFHPEHHLVDRIGWLRAAVLGANDGILSTASLIVGVAAAASAKVLFLSQVLPGWSPVLCRWLPVNMCLSVRNPTLNGRISRGNARS